MRDYTRREHERHGSKDDRGSNSEERLMVAGGEATDLQLCFALGQIVTRLSADKAVALIRGYGEVPWDEE